MVDIAFVVASELGCEELVLHVLNARLESHVEVGGSASEHLFSVEHLCAVEEHVILGPERSEEGLCF